MTELTVKTPSQEIMEDTNRIVSVTDARGRVFEFRRINMAIRRRVFKTISSENGEKDRYLGLAMLAASVVSIDGTRVNFPTSEMQFDALIDRLDDDGFEALARGTLEKFSEKDKNTAGE